MNFKNLKVIILSLLATSLFAGCVNIQYSGKSYSPTKNVKFFAKKAAIKKPYTVMGKAVATAPEHFTTEEVEDSLVSKAEAEGANAVLLVSFAKVKSGEAREDQILNDDAPESWKVDDDSASNWNLLQGTFANTDSPSNSDGEETTYKIIVKALFLKYK